MENFTTLESRHKDIRFKAPSVFGSLHSGFHLDNLKAGLMALPESTEQVIELVSSCNALHIPIVPHGGLTGLSGAAATHADQLILNTSQLNRIIAIDPIGGNATVECGVTLAALEKEVNQHGLTCGIDLAARDTATIGGMVATNAGGIEAFRNGIMRNRVLGLEAVLADGRIVNDMKRVTKSNEGYDLKQLFIGAEGTLGVITKVVVSLLPKTTQSSTAMVSCESTEQAVALFHKLRHHAELDLLSAELMWPEYATTVAKATGLESVLLFDEDENSLLVLVEVAAEKPRADEVFQTLLMELLEEQQIRCVVIAKNEKERNDMWRIREDSFAIDDAYPHGFWFDISVPLNCMSDYATQVKQRIAAISPDIKTFLFAHLGDGNFHATVTTGRPAPELEAPISAAIYEDLNTMGGSFSAEHGIGIDKRESLSKYAPETSLQVMQQIKKVLDPNGIMNPGKVI